MCSSPAVSGLTGRTIFAYFMPWMEDFRLVVAWALAYLALVHVVPTFLSRDTPAAAERRDRYLVPVLKVAHAA